MLCGVGGSIGTPALIPLLLLIQKLNVSSFYVLKLSDLMTKGLEHLAFEERVEIV